MERCSDGQDHANGGQLDNRREGFAEIHTGALGETSDNPTGFVPIQGAVRVKFMLEDPLPRDDMGDKWAIDEAPSAVGPKGGELLLHGRMLIRILEHGARRGQEWRDHVTWR